MTGTKARFESHREDMSGDEREAEEQSEENEREAQITKHGRQGWDGYYGVRVAVEGGPGGEVE